MKLYVLYIIITTLEIGSGVNNDETMTSEEDKLYYKATYSDTSCLYAREDDQFPSADDNNFTFPENSIFFIETTCRGGLDFRQACSVETAARAHPNKQINVLFAGSDTTKNSTKQNFLKVLLKHKNVKFYKVHITDYAKGTPLEDVVAKDLKRSQYVAYHASDVLRFLTLYKFGGTYLDLDVFVVKSFDHLPVTKNWIGRDTDEGLAVGLLALSRTGIGKELIEEIFHLLKHNFTADVWGGNGIDIITRALEKVCDMDWKDIFPNNCKGFKVYEPSYFYPIVSDYYERILQPIEGTLNLTKVYAFHLWNYLIADENIPDDSLHALLSKKYCPNINEVNNEHVKYTLNSSHQYSPYLRTLRLQRSQADIIYNNIDINLREKLLNHSKKTVLRKLNHQHYRTLKDFKRNMRPNYHNIHFGPIERFNRRKPKEKKSVKIRRKGYHNLR